LYRLAFAESSFDESSFAENSFAENSPTLLKKFTDFSERFGFSVGCPVLLLQV
jgi:hypothetical protein